MLEFLRIMKVAIPVALLLVGLSPLHAQGADPQTAEQLLNKAQVQFQNRDFVDARETLWQTYEKRSTLDKPQLKLLADLLGEVDAAIDKQADAQKAYDQAILAARNDQLRQAKTGLETASQCPYLKATVRAEARKRLGDVEIQLAQQLASAQQTQDDQTLVLAEDATVEPPMIVGDDTAADVDAVLVEETTIIAEPADQMQDATDDPQADEPDMIIVDQETTLVVDEAPADDVPPVMSELQKRKLAAGSFIARGKAALENNQPDEAVTFLNEALKLDPDNEMAVRLLNHARELTGRHGEASIISEYERINRIQQQETVFAYEQAMDRAYELMSTAKSTDDYQAAKQAATLAANKIKTNKRLFSDNEYQQRLAAAQQRLASIEEQQEQYNIRKVRAVATDTARAAAQRAEQASQDRQREISELTQRVSELRQERRYEDALEVLYQIDKLDPGNDWVLDSIDILTQFKYLREQENANARGRNEDTKTNIAIQHDEVPWYDKIRYPKDWIQLTREREPYGAATIAESAENRRVRELLEQRIPLKFSEVPFVDVVNYLRTVTGANFWVNWRALETVGVDRSTPVTMDLTDVPAEKALRTILDDVGGGTAELSFVISDSLVRISTREDLNRDTETRVYDIRDVIVVIRNFDAPRFDLGDNEAGGNNNQNGGAGGGGGIGGGLWGDDDDDDDDDEDEVTREDMVNQITTMITDTIDPYSWRPDGEIGSINELSGNLIITQTAENHRKVADLIAKLREARTIQISIEARFITVTTGFLNQIGVNLDFYFNLGSQIGTTNYTIPGAGAGGGDLVTPSPTHGPSYWQQAGHGVSGYGSKFSPVNLTTNFDFANVRGAATNISGGVGTSVSAPSMSIGGTFLDDIQVDFLIQATQAHATTRVLTAPRVTLMSGQRAYVTVASQTAYIAGVEPLVADTSSAYAPIIDFVPTGTILDVEATVSHDRRYVIMTVRPQVVQLVGEVVTTTNVDLGGGVQVPIGLPVVSIQELETTCSVPDRGTLLLGGQRLSTELEREQGVPVVSKIPLLNRAFTNRGKKRDQQTLLILVKPTIIMQDIVEQDPRRHVATEPFGPGLGRFD